MKKFCVVLLSGISSFMTAHAQSDWSAPIVIAPDSLRGIFSSPKLAVGPGGKLAATWMMQDGRSSGTFQTRFPFTRQSTVYAAFSNDRGQNWTEPQLISDPQLLGSEVDVSAGTTGDFHFAWTSGDALSGYRLHLASSPDLGNSVTSSIRLQSYLESGQGALFPDVETAGVHQIISWSGVSQDVENRPFKRYVSSFTLGSAEWTEPAELQSPLGPEDHVYSEPHMAADGPNIVSAGSVVSATATVDNPAPRAYTVRSTDSGATWSSSQYPTQTMYTYRPNIATDGSGTFLLMYFGRNNPSATSLRFGQLTIQRSFDAGLTWSEPYQTSSTSVAPASTRISIAGDGNNRWFAVTGNNYTYSSDNGITWSNLTSLPSNALFRGELQCKYLGNGMWGLIGGNNWSQSEQKIQLITMQWGPSAVADWTLY